MASKSNVPNHATANKTNDSRADRPNMRALVSFEVPEPEHFLLLSAAKITQLMTRIKQQITQKAKDSPKDYTTDALNLMIARADLFAMPFLEGTQTAKEYDKNTNIVNRGMTDTRNAIYNKVNIDNYRSRAYITMKIKPSETDGFRPKLIELASHAPRAAKVICLANGTEDKGERKNAVHNARFRMSDIFPGPLLQELIMDDTVTLIYVGYSGNSKGISGLTTDAVKKGGNWPYVRDVSLFYREQDVVRVPYSPLLEEGMAWYIEGLAHHVGHQALFDGYMSSTMAADNFEFHPPLPGLPTVINNSAFRTLAYGYFVSWLDYIESAQLGLLSGWLFDCKAGDLYASGGTESKVVKYDCTQASCADKFPSIAALMAHISNPHP